MFRCVDLFRNASERPRSCQTQARAHKADLKVWVLEAVDALGPSSVVAVSRFVWEHYEAELRRSDALFFTWQYDLRWAAQALRDDGHLGPVGRGRAALWRRA